VVLLTTIRRNKMDNQVTFTIKGEQYTKLMVFVEEHKACSGLSAGEKFFFQFIPTMFGVITTVRCRCGKSIDVTDMDM
jgi:hypothetical protein